MDVLRLDRVRYITHARVDESLAMYTAHISISKWALLNLL